MLRIVKAGFEPSRAVPSGLPRLVFGGVGWFAELIQKEYNRNVFYCAAVTLKSRLLEHCGVQPL
jgi:hypothetical protein